MKSTLIDITNNKYGRLTVIKRVFPNYITPKGKQMSRWECICDCGKKSIKNKGALTSGNTKSCGCLKKEKAPQNKKQIKDSSLKRLYTLYKYSAQKRNHSFELTKLDFNNLILENCFYCGEKANNEFKCHKHGIPIKYTGIDRVDSSLGYNKNNCVPCCKNCNIAKMQMQQEEFFKFIDKIYNNLKMKKLI